MQPNTLTLIHDLADAVALQSPEQIFIAAKLLAERLGTPAAIAVTQALTSEVKPLETVLEHSSGLARCA